MGSRRSKQKIEVPKPVVYRTVVPEEDFDRANEYSSFLDDKREGLINYGINTLGNARSRALDRRSDRMAELGAYYGSIPENQGSGGFNMPSDVRNQFKEAFDQSARDVDLARDKFRETIQGGNPDSQIPHGNAGAGRGGIDSDTGLAAYQRYLKNYDRTARGRGSEEGKDVLSALDIRHIRGAAGDFGVGGDVADKAVVKYARSLEDTTDMGGGTFTELEKLGGSGYEEQREMLRRREAKKKSEEQKKKKDEDKDKDRGFENLSGKSRFQEEQYGRGGASRYQRTGMSTGRPGGG